MSILHYGISIGEIGIVTEDLIGFWRMDEGSGQSVADSSQNLKHLTLGADTSVASDDPSWITEGLDFTSLQHLSSDDDPIFYPVAFSLTFALRLKDSNTHTILRWKSGSTYPIIFFNNSILRIGFSLAPDTLRNFSYSPGTSWHIMTITCDAYSQAGISSTKLYRNNVQASVVSTFANGTPLIRDIFKLGGFSSAINVEIGLAAMHAKALSVAEVSQMFIFFRNIMQTRGVTI